MLPLHHSRLHSLTIVIAVAASKNEMQFLSLFVICTSFQVSKSSVTGGTDKIRLIEENEALIAETSILRTGLKVEQRENRKMQSILGLGNKYMLPKDAQKKLDDAIVAREEIHKKYKDRMKVNRCL